MVRDCNRYKAVLKSVQPYSCAGWQAGSAWAMASPTHQGAGCSPGCAAVGLCRLPTVQGHRGAC